ncbi:hypothetical protein, partial [Bacteroides sp. An269]|uniref:hypothetical protein n=1 Tax=Bacteroides sp. An269 TaxID=1965613 RepID=UPI0019CFF02A
RRTGAKRTKKSPKAHTKTDTSSQEKLFGEIQNSFLYCIAFSHATGKLSARNKCFSQFYCIETKVSLQ